MKFLPPYLWLFPLLLGAIAGCSESKISQCDRLIREIKQISSEARSVLPNPSLAAIEKSLAVTEQGANQISALKLSDRQLQAYQSSLVSLYRSNSQSTQEFLTAFAAKDRTKANLALDKWRKNAFSDRERQLTAQINTYCFSR